MIAEAYVSDYKFRYQGSVDIVLINEEYKKVIIIDNKTWGIAKNTYGLPNNYKKNYGKLKKVALQLSLYGETYRQKGYEIESIWVLVLHKDGVYPYSLPIVGKKDIEDIMEKWEVKKYLF